MAVIVWETETLSHLKRVQAPALRQDGARLFGDDSHLIGITTHKAEDAIGIWKRMD